VEATAARSDHIGHVFGAEGSGFGGEFGNGETAHDFFRVGS